MLTLLSAFSLCSCKGLELENKTEQVEGYTQPQAMVLIANARNRYENVYGATVWDIGVGDDGTGFDKLVVQNVRQYLEKVKLLCMLAEEKGITVSSSERDVVRQMTDKFMLSLSEADLKYMGCDRDDVQTVYNDIFLAGKLIGEITASVNSEISDSEAKVIKIQQIVTADEKKAKAILKRVKIDGVNFNSMAARYSESDVIDRIMLKTAHEDLIERTAFSLEENQVSNILYKDGLYYIIMCTDGYAREETLKRKERLEQAINSKAVSDVLDPYENEHNIRFMERFWNEIDFEEPNDSTADCFFDIYNSMD